MLVSIPGILAKKVKENSRTVFCMLSLFGLFSFTFCLSVGFSFSKEWGMDIQFYR